MPLEIVQILSLLLLPIEEGSGKADWREEGPGGEVEPIGEQGIDGPDAAVHDGLPAGGDEIGDGVYRVHRCVAHLMADLHSGSADVVYGLHSHVSGGAHGSWTQKRQIKNLKKK